MKDSGACSPECVEQLEEQVAFSKLIDTTTVYAVVSFNVSVKNQKMTCEQIQDLFSEFIDYKMSLKENDKISLGRSDMFWIGGEKPDVS